jgi:streptogramin lyase
MGTLKATLAAARWMTAFILVFVVSSAAPVLADPASEPPPPATPSAEGEQSFSPQLPTDQDMAEALAQFEREEREKQRELESPAAASEREASRTEYAGLDAADAAQLLNTQFAEALDSLNAEPARFLSDATLEHPLGETSAAVTSDGRKQLMEGTLPVRAPNDEGDLAKIDLTLEGTAEGYEPVNPLVDVTIPESSAEGVEVGDAGLQISQIGAPAEESIGRPFGDMNVFYPEVATDTDLLVSPIEAGVELFEQLRSESSPEDLRFHVDLPEGSSLLSNDGGAKVVSEEGSTLDVIPAPTAVDSQGSQVPVEMTVDGDSLAIQVAHRSEEFAYPILVDPPIKEEWYFPNWYIGQNLQALTNGAWHWWTSEGAGSSYVYGSTSYIYKSWGSGRGLYISTPNGNIPGGKWGHWYYSTPNSQTYLANAWVSPLVRDNEACDPGHGYAQPYDYVGMWNQGAWTRILYNQSNTKPELGHVDIQSWGEAFMIGMGTSSNVSIPCKRSIVGGGVAIWLEDWSRPELTTSSNEVWMDDHLTARPNVSAYDSGLGVRQFEASATNVSGERQTWWTTNSCTGLYEAPCPHTWNPPLSFSVSSLPEGIDRLSIIAYDAAEKPSFTTNEVNVRIDHAPPSITLSGTLTEQAKLGSELPHYSIGVKALDGDPTSSEQSKARSGVKDVSVEVDGAAVTPTFTPECAGQMNCGAFEELGVPAVEMTPGPHTLKVKAHDAYGHLATKELAFSTGDKTPPALAVTGGPTESTMPAYVSTFGSLGSGNGQLNHPDDIAVGAQGNIWVADQNNNRVSQFNENGVYLGLLDPHGASVSCPTGIASDGKGHLWIVEKCNNRVQEFNEAGGLIRSFGATGTRPGEFNSPEGIAVDGKGNVWVSDTANARIQEFNESGETMRMVGSRGSAPGQLIEPCGLDFDAAGNVYVADWSNNRVEKYNEKGEFITQFGTTGPGAGQLQRPFGLDVDGSGNIWVVDTGNGRVEEFDSGGEYVAKFGSAGTGSGQFNFSYPAGIEVDSGGRAWVTDTNNNRFEKWRPASSLNPGYASAFGASGSGNGQLSHPADVALDSKGNLWVVDENNNRIEEFNEKGEYLGKFGTGGSGNGQLSCPAGVAIDAKGNFWVADRCNNRVQEFNEKGEYVRKFGSLGTGPGQFNGPEGIGVDGKGNVWVSDTDGARLEEFNEKGEFIRSVGSRGSAPGQLIEPCGLDFDAAGNVYVADWSNNRVEKYNEKGEFITQFGTTGPGAGQLQRPFGLDVDGKGGVWVLDTGNSRVEKFSEGGDYIAKFGSSGTGAGQFNLSYPAGIIADASSRIWVTDTNNNRVEKWLDPVGGIGSAVGLSAADKGSGVTSLSVGLTSALGQTVALEQLSQSCPSGACSLSAGSFELSNQAAGVYMVTGTAKDGAGYEASLSRVVALDPKPPKISLSGSLAERAGQPLNASSGELAVKATDADLPGSGVKAINIEREHQRVASYRSNCSSSCQEVTASYRYNAARDGAERAIRAAATPPGATSSILRSIACSAGSNCDAVGYTTSAGKIVTLAEHWDGKEWMVRSTPNPAGASESRLEGVSCTSASNCMAVGNYKAGSVVAALAERWNGSTWSLVTTPASGTPAPYLYGISCSGPSDCWAVGKSGYQQGEEVEHKPVSAALLEHWNGAWSIVSSASAPGPLSKVSCASTSSCVAVTGQEGLALVRWNGSTWAQQTVAAPPTGPNGATLKDISCQGSVCTVVGASSVNGHSAPLVERWNGTQWSVQPATDPVGIVEETTSSSLEGISCPSAGACTAVGVRTTASETQPLIEGWDGTDWSLQPTAVPSGVSGSALGKVSCTGGFECLAVGSKNSETGAWSESEVPGKGSQTVSVEAVDKYGNAESKSIAVDVPDESQGAPECNQKAKSVSPKGILTSSQATSAIEASVPAAVAPSQPTSNESTDEEVDPSYSAPQPNLDSVGNLAEGETSITPQGGFALKGIACITPAVTTSAATQAKVVNGDAALFANTAPETDTVIRPSAGGMTLMQSLRGPDAPTTISWHIDLSSDEKLMKLPSGALAVTRAGSAGEANGETPEVAKPEGFQTTQALNSAAVQLEASEYQLALADRETTEEVIAVIGRPWVILNQKSILPIEVIIEADTATPTEYDATYVLPPWEPNVFPEAVVEEATTSSAVNGHCLDSEHSPCGEFNIGAANSYAEYWGSEQHPRNPEFHDFGDDNCTNFISQILLHGGMRFMRAFEHGDGSWWYQRAQIPKGHYDYTESWTVADILPRHLWQYGLAHIDPSNQPSGWTAGDLIAEDWYSTNGKGDFNHLQFVVGTTTTSGESREPLIANESSPGSNYSHLKWFIVKQKIEVEHGTEWNRVPLAVKHTNAELDAKKHAPANLYGPEGVFNG